MAIIEIEDPEVVAKAKVGVGSVQIVEWNWPEIFEWRNVEKSLMLEMSLPPHSEDASASFPEIEPDRFSYVGTLFIRCPGVLIHGRSAGGRVRVLRWIFNQETAERIVPSGTVPDLDVLRSLFNIRNDALRSLMRLTYRELAERPDRSNEALEHLGQLAALELTRFINSKPQPKLGGRLAAWQFRRIRERLAAGGERPSVAELAQLCGISPRHLHRQFQALTGETISHYIERFLIDEAKEMLTKRNEPIKSVALSCGFMHPNSFSRAFRRVTGVTPQQFRQRAGPRLKASQ